MDDIFDSQSWTGSFDDYDGAEVAAEHQLRHPPAYTAHLTKGEEVVWINAYTDPKMVVETYPAYTTADGIELPGIVRDVPCGFHTPLNQRFAEQVLRHESNGWKHTSPTDKTL